MRLKILKGNFIVKNPQKKDFKVWLISKNNSIFIKLVIGFSFNSYLSLIFIELSPSFKRTLSFLSFNYQS